MSQIMATASRDPQQIIMIMDHSCQECCRDGKIAHQSRVYILRRRSIGIQTRIIIGGRLVVCVRAYVTCAALLLPSKESAVTIQSHQLTHTNQRSIYDDVTSHTRF